MHYISVCMAYGYGVSGYVYYLPYHIIHFLFHAFTTSLPRGSVAQNDTSTGKWRLRGWRTTLWWTSGAGTTWASPRPAMDRLGRLGRGTAGQTAGKTEVLFLGGFIEISEVKWSHWSFETEDIEDAGAWNFPRKSRKFQEFFGGYFYGVEDVEVAGWASQAQGRPPSGPWKRAFGIFVPWPWMPWVNILGTAGNYLICRIPWVLNELRSKTEAVSARNDFHEVWSHPAQIVSSSVVLFEFPGTEWNTAHPDVPVLKYQLFELWAPLGATWDASTEGGHSGQHGRLVFSWIS